MKIKEKIGIGISNFLRPYILNNNIGLGGKMEDNKNK